MTKQLHAFLINLDGMDASDLAKYARQLRAAYPSVCALPSLAGIRDPERLAIRCLYGYAIKTAEAMESRAFGTIGRALREEASAQAYYDAMPAFAKW